MSPTPFDDLADGVMDAAKNALGVGAVYFSKKNPAPQPIRVIFDDRHTFIDPDTEIPVTGNTVTAGLRLKDLLSAPRQGDKIRILEGKKAGQLYEVIDPQDDGVAGADLVLHEVSEP